MYKIKASYSLIMFVLMGLLPSLVLAQEEKSNCVLQLEEAQVKYNQGRIQDIEGLIGSCLENNEFEKLEKVQALKLLTLSYLFLEEPELAEETMLDLLKTNHEFAVNPAIDPSEFINLYEKFRHDPIFNVGGLFGFVFGSPIITDLNGTPDLNGSRQSYSPLLGIKADLSIEYKFKPKLYLLGGLSFQIIEFEKTHESPKIISGDFNGVGFKGAEEVTSIEIPLVAQYHILEKNKFTFYGGIGIAPQLLLSESYQSDATIFDIDGSGLVTTNTVDLTNDRQKFNISAIGIIGMKMKIAEGYLNFRIRYSQQVLNSSNPVNSLTPSNPNLLWDLTDAYDGFRLQDVGFSAGYTLNIYIPKKLR